MPVMNKECLSMKQTQLEKVDNIAETNKKILVCEYFVLISFFVIFLNIA